MVKRLKKGKNKRVPKVRVNPMNILRDCPQCGGKFTWADTRKGQIFCKKDCYLIADPDQFEEKTKQKAVNDETLRFLREAFAWGATDEEACNHAKIGTTAFYKYKAKHADFAEEVARLKETPTLNSRRNIAKDIEDGSIETSKWWLERKKKNEFGRKHFVEGSVDLQATDTHLERVKKVLGQNAMLEIENIENEDSQD